MARGSSDSIIALKRELRTNELRRGEGHVRRRCAAAPMLRSGGRIRGVNAAALGSLFSLSKVSYVRCCNRSGDTLGTRRLRVPSSQGPRSTSAAISRSRGSGTNDLTPPTGPVRRRLKFPHPVHSRLSNMKLLKPSIPWVFASSRGRRRHACRDLYRRVSKSA